MRALVTGANGFVGQHLVRELLARGATVVGTVTTPGSLGLTVLTPGEAAAVEWLGLDLTAPAAVARLMHEVADRVDVVFHLAAQSSVGGSFREPEATWEINATGTWRLLQALPGDRPLRVLLPSSAEVYGTVAEAEQPIREDRPLRPQNPYAASKAAAEMAALEATHAGRAQVVIARSFNHTGPGQDTRFALPSFASQLAAMRGSGEGVLRVGNLSARRDLLDVRDVVRAYLTLAARGEPGEAYNVCAGEAQSLRELVDTLVELSGTGARIEVDPERLRPMEVPLLLGDAGKLRRLGWTPLIELRATLAELLASGRGGAG